MINEKYKLARFTIETPPFGKGVAIKDSKGDLCKFSDIQDRLSECIDELLSINENSVSEIALESIQCVIEDLKAISNHEEINT